MDTFYFILAKFVGFAARVETWLLVLACLTFLSTLRGNLRRARRSSGLLVGTLLVIGFLPLGDLLLRPVEASVTTIAEPGPVSGVIVLGGGEDIPASSLSGTPQLGQGGERLLTAVALARHHPEARIVFAGGGGRLRDLTGPALSEAEIAKRIFREQGLAPDRLLFESRSRNTAENAHLAYDLVQPGPNDRWLLVTSAFHMPRALRSFMTAGWEGLAPYPVDFRSWAWADGLGWNFGRNLEMLNTGLREWIGHAAYAVLGR